MFFSALYCGAQPQNRSVHLQTLVPTLCAPLCLPHCVPRTRQSPYDSLYFSLPSLWRSSAALPCHPTTPKKGTGQGAHTATRTKACRRPMNCFANAQRTLAGTFGLRLKKKRPRAIALWGHISSLLVDAAPRLCPISQNVYTSAGPPLRHIICMVCGNCTHSVHCLFRIWSISVCPCGRGSSRWVEAWAGFCTVASFCTPPWLACVPKVCSICSNDVCKGHPPSALQPHLCRGGT